MKRKSVCISTETTDRDGSHRIARGVARRLVASAAIENRAGARQVIGRSNDAPLAGVAVDADDEAKDGGQSDLTERVADADFTQHGQGRALADLQRCTLTSTRTVPAGWRESG